jgi:hypothetical protein
MVVGLSGYISTLNCTLEKYESYVNFSSINVLENLMLQQNNNGIMLATKKHSIIAYYIAVMV